MFSKISSREIAILAGLTALSVLLQINHLGYQHPFGMWIDLVAIFWLIAFFLYGSRGYWLVSIVTATILALIDNNSYPWLGAMMKFLATTATVLPFMILSFKQKFALSSFAQPKNLLLPLFAGLVLRSIVMYLMNYYYAIPIWTGLTTEVAMQTIPWTIVVGFNLIQGILDVIVAWVLVYKFNLKKFGAK